MPRVLRPESAFFRRLAYVGARFGPRAWLRYSPPVFGAAFALGLGRTRRQVRDNLRRVRGQRSFFEEQRDVLQTFTSYAACLAEALGADRTDLTAARVKVTGKEHLSRALAHGRGLVMLTGHVGPWDVAARLLAQDLAVDVLVVMLAEPDARARSLHDGVRARGGLRVVHVGAHPLDALPLLEHVRLGGVVAVQLDRAPAQSRALSVEMFGNAFRVPEGPFRLAALSGAPILPVFAHRAGYRDYELCVSPAIELSRWARGEELSSAAQCAADAMQRFISAHPTEWFQFGSESPVGRS